MLKPIKGILSTKLVMRLSYTLNRCVRTQRAKARARISNEYTISIPRPRDLVRARLHPSYAPLLEKLWNDLSHEVHGSSNGNGHAAKDSIYMAAE